MKRNLVWVGSSCLCFLNYWISPGPGEESDTPVNISLSGVQSYISSPGIASKIGCVVHEQLHTIFCLKCQQAILPKDIPGHVCAQHNIKMSNADSRNLVELVTTYQLHMTHAEVKYPAPGDPPVEVLEMFPGFVCWMCHYCCCTESSIDIFVVTLYKIGTHPVWATFVQPPTWKHYFLALQKLILKLTHYLTACLPQISSMQLWRMLQIYLIYTMPKCTQGTSIQQVDKMRGFSHQ